MAPILQPRTVHCLKLQIQMASFLKVIPYEYSKRTGLIQVFPSLTKRILWKLNMLAGLSYAAFIYARCYQVLKFNDFESINKTHFAIQVASATGVSMGVAGHMAVYCGVDEIRDFINSYFTFLQKMNEKYQHAAPKPKAGRRLRLAELLLQLFPFTPWLSCVPHFFGVLFLPACPSYPGSILDPSYRDWWPILVAGGLLDYFIVLCIWKQVIFLSGNLMAFLDISTTVLKNMRATLEDSQIKKGSEFKQYRTMQVLSNKFNSCYIPVLTTFGSCAVFLTEVTTGLAAIKLVTVIPLIVFPVFPFLKLAIALSTFSLLRAGANYYEGSKDVLRTWNNSSNFKGMQAFVRSCQPLKMYIGMVTYVAKASTIAYMALVIHNTINALIALEV